jgi:hypothetical protein
MASFERGVGATDVWSTPESAFSDIYVTTREHVAAGP